MTRTANFTLPNDFPTVTAQTFLWLYELTQRFLSVSTGLLGTAIMEQTSSHPL